jgi:broad specificity phosphatase PhoE
MVQHIYFVRYGLTKYPLVENMGPYDSPLHPIYGYEQGIAIARRLAGMPAPPDVVYSSSLHRAVSTSQLIVHALGKTHNSIRIEDGLIEWLTPSLTVEPDGTRLQPRTVQELVDMTFTEIDVQYQSVNPIIATDPSDLYYGAPYFFESEDYLVNKRAKVTMERIIQHANGENICIVSHTPCAQAMALYLEGAASLGESKIGPWPLGGITMFVKDTTMDSGWKLEMYADCSHMPGEYKNGLKPWSLPCLTKS